MPFTNLIRIELNEYFGQTDEFEWAFSSIITRLAIAEEAINGLGLNLIRIGMSLWVSQLLSLLDSYGCSFGNSYFSDSLHPSHCNDPERLRCRDRLYDFAATNRPDELLFRESTSSLTFNGCGPR